MALNGHAGVAARQFNGLIPSVTVSASASCSAFTLPSGGVLRLSDSAITLTTNIVFQPVCTGPGSRFVTSIGGKGYPFYGSTTPQTYVIAAGTIIAWVLLVMLLITSRTNFFGTGAASLGFGNSRGFIGGAHGGVSHPAGIGPRPWLQKVAALSVAIGFALATADLFRVARQQYHNGFEDAEALRNKVLGSQEIKITRVVSDIFLWLAQVQTLVRLFPRHKEKVIIKWIGFVLILCDAVFASLNVGLVPSNGFAPGHFEDAIPALLYLFELALGLLYAAWVIYYSLTKRRYAFYHAKMKNIFFIAALSLVAILTPVVFFVVDVSNHDIAGWGDYIRWVGACAASVVVWEWVERIEALERDEKKDGILGREVFDGDEMVDVMPSQDVLYTASRRHRSHLRRYDDNGAGSGDEGGLPQSSALEKGLYNVTARMRKKPRSLRSHFPLGRAHSRTTISQASRPVEQTNSDQTYPPSSITFGAMPKPRDPAGRQVLGQPLPPPIIASPVSRTDTTSAASTVYVVHYHQTRDGTVVDGENVDNLTRFDGPLSAQPSKSQSTQPNAQDSHFKDPEKEAHETSDDDIVRNQSRDRSAAPAWLSVPNPFKRKRSSLPREVQAVAGVNSENAEGGVQATTPTHNFSRWDIRNRLGVLAAETGERVRDRAAARRQQQSEDSPVVVIPPPARGSGRVWTPDGIVVPKDSSSEDSSIGTSDFTLQLSKKKSPAGDQLVPAASSGRLTEGSTLVALSSSRSSRPERSSETSVSPPQRPESRTTSNIGPSTPRPESLSPSHSHGGNTITIISPPTRVRKNRSPLATHSETPSQEEE